MRSGPAAKEFADGAAADHVWGTPATTQSVPDVDEAARIVADPRRRRRPRIWLSAPFSISDQSPENSSGAAGRGAGTRTRATSYSRRETAGPSATRRHRYP